MGVFVVLDHDGLPATQPPSRWLCRPCPGKIHGRAWLASEKTAANPPGEKPAMAKVPVQIVRLISDRQPGFVAAELRDAYGNVHTFHDKVPIFCDGYLDADSLYPQPGVLACEVVKRWTADDGRLLALIDTEKPWDIPSTLDEYRFVVLAEQVSDDARPPDRLQPQNDPSPAGSTSGPPVE